MDLIAELREARGRFHDHPGNYATDISIDLLDNAIAELERLREIEERAREVGALGVPRDSPHFRPNSDPSSAVFAARHILGES